MQFKAIILLNAALASAASITVTNKCSFEVNSQHGYQGGNDRAVTLAKNGGQTTQQIGTSPGQLLKFYTGSDVSDVIQFNWTPSRGNTYTGIGEVGSSPLVKHANSFVPSSTSGNCYAVKCAAGDESCYHKAGGPTCASSTNFAITLCA